MQKKYTIKSLLLIAINKYEYITLLNRVSIINPINVQVNVV